uniref:Small ubiquitin-related modifier n=1 Tax=Solanum chacoense TaxID=4108 RepID=A0A0V0HHD5_SOLCH
MQDGNEVFFRIKRSTQMRKLMNAYCDRQSVDMNSIAFLFDGRRLRAEQTPDELEMEEGDEIDAMLHQTGGSDAGCFTCFCNFNLVYVSRLFRVILSECWYYSLICSKMGKFMNV